MQVPAIAMIKYVGYVLEKKNRKKNVVCVKSDDMNPVQLFKSMGIN